jgi:hypothetical protein
VRRLFWVSPPDQASRAPCHFVRLLCTSLSPSPGLSFPGCPGYISRHSSQSKADQRTALFELKEREVSHYIPDRAINECALGEKRLRLTAALQQLELPSLRGTPKWSKAEDGRYEGGKMGRRRRYFWVRTNEEALIRL